MGRIRNNHLFCSLIVVLCGVVASCDRAPASSGGSGSDSLTVFAAASLSAPMKALAARFTEQHEEMPVRLNLAGSHTLATQALSGAPFDLFISADEAQINRVHRAALTGPAQPFLACDLVLAVAVDSSVEITALEDVGRADVRFVLGAESLPIGEYARTVLARAGILAEALGQTVSIESSITGITAKLTTGSADAAIVYRSSFAADHPSVRLVEIGPAHNVRTTYSLALSAESSPDSPAARFAAWIQSESQLDVFRQYGYEAVAR